MLRNKCYTGVEHPYKVSQTVKGYPLNTLVLTKNGVKRVQDVTLKDEVFVLDQVTKDRGFLKPEGIIRKQCNVSSVVEVQYTYGSLKVNENNMLSILSDKEFKLTKITDLGVSGSEDLDKDEFLFNGLFDVPCIDGINDEALWSSGLFTGLFMLTNNENRKKLQNSKSNVYLYSVDKEKRIEKTLLYLYDQGVRYDTVDSLEDNIKVTLHGLNNVSTYKYIRHLDYTKSGMSLSYKVWSLSDSEKLSFLLGVLSAQDEVNTHYGFVEVRSFSEQFIKDIIFLCATLGIVVVGDRSENFVDGERIYSATVKIPEWCTSILGNHRKEATIDDPLEGKQKQFYLLLNIEDVKNREKVDELISFSFMGPFSPLVTTIGYPTYV